MSGASVSAPWVVIDTNIVLDVFVFDEPSLLTLKAALLARQLDWIATAAMRDELQRVLGYPNIVRWLSKTGKQAEGVLSAVDAQWRLLPAPVVTGIRCRDPDDQKFIDLAVAHTAWLLSKDHEVLRLIPSLRMQGVKVSATFP